VLSSLAGSVDTLNAMSMLTGPFETAELPRLGDGPVTVTVERSVKPGCELQFEALAAEFESQLGPFPGFLGLGVLKPGVGGSEYQIVFRFTDPINLRRWEKSDERAAVLAELEPLVAETRVTSVHGTDRFFDLPELAPPVRPRWQSHLSDILWVSPVAAVVGLVVSPHLAFLPFPARVTSGVVIMTVILGELVAPVRRQLRKRRNAI
jgi:uncharacterized protein